MKSKLIILFLAMAVLIPTADAQGVRYAVGINGGLSVLNPSVTTPGGKGHQSEDSWQLGLRGEVMVPVVGALKANSILDINFFRNRELSTDVFLLTNEHVDKWIEKQKTMALQLTEYFNYGLPFNWAVGTGPSVRFCGKGVSGHSHWTAFWTFGVDKSFYHHFNARLMWMQAMGKTHPAYRNMLNLSLTYTF